MQIKGRTKYCLIAIIVMFIVFVTGASIITTADNILDQKQIEYSDVVVADKYLNNDSNHYYVVVSETGTVYDIVNFTDSNNIFQHLKVGNAYRFVTQKPLSQDDKYIHIVQVFNETN